jgi:hypothetical protein
MAQLYSTGPAHAFVGSISSGGVTPFYLGTCEVAPQIEVTPRFEEVHNDIGGIVPFDKQYGGEEAFIGLDLNRYNEGVYAALAARPNSLVAGAVRGLNSALDVGTLMLTEGKNVVLWIVFPFFAKPAMRAGGMPAGYRFPGSILLGPDKLDGLGTRSRKTHLFFEALRLWTPLTGAFTLYDHNTTGLPAIN